MIDIFQKLGEYFMPQQEEEKQEEIKVIGFYTQRSGDLFIYNDWDDRFDNYLQVDLAQSAFKYKDASMLHAETCMRTEGNVGDLKELSLFI